MQIPVAVERVKGNGYRARSAEPLAASARGPTRKAALARLRQKIEVRLRKGTQLIGLEVGLEEHPLAAFAGMFKDDPDFEDVLKIMAENRKSIDNDPKVP